MKKIAIASDHGGVAYKEAIKKAYADQYEWLDLGTNSEDSVNYADFGHAMGRAITDGEAERGIVICGAGIGISIAANRHKALREALCTNDTMARLAREHNDANVLASGERIIDLDTALKCVETFLNTEYEGGRHDARVAKLDVGV